MGADDWDEMSNKDVWKRAPLYPAMLLPATVGLPLSIWYCARQFVPALSRHLRGSLSYSILGAASLAWTYPTMKSMGYVAETWTVLREDNPKGMFKVRWGKFEKFQGVDKNTIVRRELPPLEGSNGEPREELTKTHISKSKTTDYQKQMEFGILYVISCASLAVCSMFLLLGVKRQFPQLRIARNVALGTALFAGISYAISEQTKTKRNFAVVGFESRRKAIEQGIDEPISQVDDDQHRTTRTTTERHRTVSKVDETFTDDGLPMTVTTSYTIPQS